MTQTNKSALVAKLVDLLSSRHIALGDKQTEHYRTGWRSGGGEALAVVFPQTLLQFWQVLEVCVDAKVIIILQAANTGLTEGSTPNKSGYDRDIVIINTLAMSTLFTLGQGEQVVCFAGSTLHQLENVLSPLGRAPHSVIGSSCLGASIVGGVANNSGGALVKRGPAYTELALFAQVNEKSQLQLVNNLGIDLGNTPHEILTNLENKHFDLSSLAHAKKASASDYQEKVRDIHANTPSRFNADASRLYQASGCAGKVAVFALRLDTFAVPEKEQTFYIGTNNAEVLSQLRRDILSQFSHLPEVGEYIHRDAFGVAKTYGKDTFLSIKHLGTQRMPRFFSLKGRIDAALNKVPFLPDFLTDKVMQGLSHLFGQHLPDAMLDYEKEFEHHLILKMSDSGIEEARTYLQAYFASPERGRFFECTSSEAGDAFLHRFATAGAAVRYQTLKHKEVGDILALDVALRRNDANWFEVLPESIAQDIELKLYYGHFFCHVFHQDYVLKAGADAADVKRKMLALLDDRGAKYPAEHNVGHLYDAEQHLKDFYYSLDPTNTFNPGIGNTDKHKRNCACC